MPWRRRGAGSPGARLNRSRSRPCARCANTLDAVKIVSLPDVSRAQRRVAVGTFDGVHLGHREVIAGCDSVLTFEPHPVSVVAPAHAPKLLTDLPRKAALIEALGVA